MYILIGIAIKLPCLDLSLAVRNMEGTEEEDCQAQVQVQFAESTDTSIFFSFVKIVLYFTKIRICGFFGRILCCPKEPYYLSMVHIRV